MSILDNFLEEYKRDHYKRHPKSKIVRNIIFSILFLFLIIALKCTFPRSDATSELLGRGYFYVNASGRGMIYKGDLKKTNTHQLKISGNVEKYRFDDKFITAFRHITPLEFSDSSTNSLFKKQHNGDTLQYWIIDKIKDSIYGPLTYKEYFTLSKQFNLNSKLKL